MNISNPILIVDTETTGLDPAKDQLLEVAWAVWDPHLATLLEAHSVLVHSVVDPPEMTGIPKGACVSRGVRTKDQVIEMLTERVVNCDAIVAHNAAFDRSFLGDLNPFSTQEMAPPWICSMDDIEWPMRPNSRSLTALALAHGVGVTWAHRALADVMTLVQVFERAHQLPDPRGFGHCCNGCDSSDIVQTRWDPVHEIERATRPKAPYQAMVSYDERELAKAAGFQWDAPRKRWIRSMFTDKVAALPFKVIEVK